MYNERQQSITTIAVHIEVPQQPVRPSNTVEDLDVSKDPATGQDPDKDAALTERPVVGHMTAVERRKSRWAGRRRSWH